MNADARLQPPANRLLGNRMVLAGAVLYLLEWVAILTASVGVPLGAASSVHDVFTGYAGHAQSLGWAAGWFSICLLGRILLVIGLRSALRDSGRPHPLLDFAVAAMAVGVTLEIAAYALVAGGSWLTAHGGAVAPLRTLDAATYVLDEMLWGPTGVALVCCGVAMWVSGLFPRVLSGLGVAGGALMAVSAAFFVSPRFAGLFAGLTSAALLMWVWMLWTGVYCWLRTSAPRPAAPTVEGAGAGV